MLKAAFNTSRLALAVETARMRECYRVGPPSILAMQGAAFLVALLLSLDAAPQLLWGWFGLTLAVSVLRLALVARFRRDLSRHNLTLPNENLYAAAGLLTGLTWSSLLLAVAPQSRSVELLLVVIVVAMAYSSIITIGISLKTYCAVTAPILSAEAVAFLLRSRLGAEIHWPVFLLLPIAIAAALAMYRRSVMPGLLQQQEMQVLTDELQAMFDNTLVGIAHIRDRRFVSVNAECAHIYGLDAQQMVGAPITLVFDSSSNGAAVMAQVEVELREHGAARSTRPITGARTASAATCWRKATASTARSRPRARSGC